MNFDSSQKKVVYGRRCNISDIALRNSDLLHVEEVGTDLNGCVCYHVFCDLFEDFLEFGMEDGDRDGYDVLEGYMCRVFCGRCTYSDECASSQVRLARLIKNNI